jgi:hypothetical protein
MRRALLVSVMAWLVPLSAAAQQGAAAAPRTQGPMIVEPIRDGFMAAPDIKVTEMDRKTFGLVGAYAGWVTGDTFFIGGGGYWLVDTHSNDRDMAYGGLVMQWLVHNGGRLGFGAKGLVGGGEATVADTISVRLPDVRAANGRVTMPAATISERFRFREAFMIAEPEALLSIKLPKGMRLAAGVGYRFTGNEHRGLGGDRLDGATGSLALQIGGGS